MTLYALLAFIVGALLPMQAGINAQLRTTLGHPVLTALVSFLVGTLALAAVCVAQRVSLPAAGELGRAAWWHWVGGLLGAAYITVAVVVAPRLGATALVALVVGGQLLGSLLLDQYGLAGYARIPATPGRIVGAVLLMAGVLLIVQKR